MGRIWRGIVCMFERWGLVNWVWLLFCFLRFWDFWSAGSLQLLSRRWVPFFAVTPT